MFYLTCAHTLYRCRVAKEDLVAVFKTPHPYKIIPANNKHEGNTDSNRLTNGEHTGTTKNSSRGDTQSPSLSRAHNTTPLMDVSVSPALPTHKHESTSKYPSAYQTSQVSPQRTTESTTHKPELELHMPPAITVETTAAPTTTMHGRWIKVIVTEIFEKTVEPQNTWSTATSATAATVDSIHSIQKQVESSLVQNSTRQKSTGGTEVRNTHAERGLHNMTGECMQLQMLA